MKKIWVTLPDLLVFDIPDEVVLLRLVKIGGLGMRAAAADDIW